MSEHQRSEDYLKAFVEACARVLGKTPDSSRFRELALPGGQKGLTWNSYLLGMLGLGVERAYRDRFGDAPQWVLNCHLHHQHLLMQAATRWGVQLPPVMPTPIAPAPGTERDCSAPLPPGAPTEGAAKSRTPGAVELEHALTHLSESAQLRNALCKHFGRDRAELMIAMMREGRFRGGEGDELHDFLIDGIANDCKAVWAAVTTSSYDDEDVDWPIEVQGFHGVFRVWSPEYGHVGLFLSLRDAQNYVYGNWENVSEVRAAKSGD